MDEDGPTRRKSPARLQREITKRGTANLLRKGVRHEPPAALFGVGQGAAGVAAGCRHGRVGRERAPDHYTTKTITEPSHLKQRLGTVRADGYAVDDEETFAGVRCIAAPFHEHRQQVIAALGISGPTIRNTQEQLPHFAQTVMQVAAELSAKLGAPNAVL